MVKNNLLFGIGVLVAVILIAVGATSLSTKLAIFGDVVNIPEYSSLWCGACQTGFDEEEVLRFTGGPDEINKYICPQLQAASYVPKGCKYEVDAKAQSIGEVWYYLCEEKVKDSDVITQLKADLAIGTGDNVLNCQKFEIKKDIVHTITIQSDEVLFLGTEVPTTIRVQEQPFCLFTLQRGRLTSQSTCDRSRLTSLGVKDYPDITPSVIPGQEFAIENVVIGYTGIVDSVDVVESGTKFLTRDIDGIKVCNIVDAKDGSSYVDTFSCRRDSKFVCIPSELGARCLEGTSVQKEIVKGGDCTGTRQIGRQQIGNELCELTCVDNEIKVGTCKEIVAPVVPTVEPDEKGGLELLIPGLILIGGIIIAGIILIMRRRRQI